MRRARFSISVIFLVHGLVIASWVSRIPAIQSALHLSPAALGTLLLAATAGALVAMPLTGAVIHKAGSRAVVMFTTAIFCLSLPVVALATSAGELAAALFLLGAAAGAMDVAMNVEAAALEKLYRRPIMSAFHGLFSAGGMAGSAIGGAFAAAGYSPESHFVIAAPVCGAIAGGVMAWLPPGSSEAEGSLTLRLPRNLWLLGALGFCILLGEGAMADWTGVYLKSSLGTGAGTAALGYAVFSATMAAGRFAGDWLTVRLGRVRLVRGGALLAAAGLTAALAFGNVFSALLGFACAGAGFATIIPIVFGAGANVNGVAPGAGVAAVTTAGYTGFLIGPPLIGFTAEYTSLRFALGIV
ncbi:MAG TPA: MFS transporter, partial [Bryobacteraceae bacterium]|nr:MFS transporter [Bryobacteraceae bacterium]